MEKVDDSPSDTSFGSNPDNNNIHSHQPTEISLSPPPPQITEEEIEDVLKSELPTIKQQLTLNGIKQAFLGFWFKLPHYFWLFHIECLLIPTFRTEWGKFNTWKYDSSIKPKCSPEEEEIIQATKEQAKIRAKLLTRAQGRYKPHDWTGCELITINVSGTRFITQLRTLKNFPHSLLGDETKRKRFYNPKLKEYYFDRSPTCFEAILHYFQTNGKELNRPPNVPLPIFEDEFAYYEMEDTELERLRAEEGYFKDLEDTKPKPMLKRKLCLLFEYPESSFQAKILALISVFVIILSIIIFLLETLEGFELRPEDEDLHDPFFLTETLCIVWFCFEITVRFLVCVSKLHFVREFMNMVDFCAIMPYFVQIAYSSHAASEKAENEANSNFKGIEEKDEAHFGFFTVIRLIRILRILKLSRHSKGLKILARTLHASLRELGLLMFFLTVGTILFSSAIYFPEAEAVNGTSSFHSIPGAFFYSITTMATVGYGNEVPKTFFGRLIGSLCAIAGVLTLALPVPVIVANFNYFYHRESDQQYAHLHHAKYHFVHVCPCRPECEEIRATEFEKLKKATEENKDGIDQLEIKSIVNEKGDVEELFHEDKEDMNELLGMLEYPFARIPDELNYMIKKKSVAKPSKARVENAYHRVLKNTRKNIK